MRKYTKAQALVGAEMWKKIAPQLQPIANLDKDDQCLGKIADIMMRLINNQPVNKTLTHYFHCCAGIGDSSYSTFPKPHSDELSRLVSNAIDTIERLTKNHVDSQAWHGTWPLIAFPVHKSGTPKKPAWLTPKDEDE